MVTYPLEQKLSEIEQIKHTYSISRPGVAVPDGGVRRGREAPARAGAPVRQGVLEPGLDAGEPRRGAQPIISHKGIDDVPVMALTLWTRTIRGAAARDLAEVAHTPSRAQAHPRHARRISPSAHRSAR